MIHLCKHLFVTVVMWHSFTNAVNVTIILKTHSSYLEKYKSYADVTIMHFNVPHNLPFVSFKFEADEMDLSIFGRF